MRAGRAPAPAILGIACAAALCMWAGCATAPRRGGTRSQSRHQLVGVASYYGPGFHRKKTASGERFNMYKLTAAHRTLPFGTRVRVTNIENGRSVVVRINDRGPFKKGRVIDLSLAAARKIGLVGSGTAKVRLKILR